MIVKKVINNNIISTIDDKGHELIVTGKGLGYKIKVDDVVDENKIEKVFRIEDKNQSLKLQELLTHISLEEIQLSDDIIHYAKEKIHVKLNDSIYVTLTDHINFALQRFAQHISFDNPLLWEIKRYYPLEFEVGEYAVKLIKERFKDDLSENEAGFIALHIVNSEYSTSIKDASKFPVGIHKILDIIQDSFHLKYDETSLSYERLLTHVKFLLQRVYRNELIQDDGLIISDSIKQQCPKEYECSCKIADYLKEVTGVEIPECEKVYMAIHIRRTISTN